MPRLPFSKQELSGFKDVLQVFGQKTFNKRINNVDNRKKHIGLINRMINNGYGEIEIANVIWISKTLEIPLVSLRTNKDWLPIIRTSKVKDNIPNCLPEQYRKYYFTLDKQFNDEFGYYVGENLLKIGFVNCLMVLGLMANEGENK